MATGVLLVNLGTPDAPTRGAVYRYLKEFLLDKRVLDISWLGRNLLVRGIIAPFRSGQSAKGYQKLWTENGSPLKHYGQVLAREVQAVLGDDFVVELAMRYQNPSVESAMKRLEAAKVSDYIVMPLFPQYASASTGSVHEEVMRLFSLRNNIPDIQFINSFYVYPPMIQIFAENARKYDIKSYDHILFSFHGLPERQLVKSDMSCSHCLKVENCCEAINLNNQFCYSAHCFATAQAIAKELDIKKEDYTVCFQSRLGRAEWKKPYTPVVLKARADKGDKRLLAFSAAFVADCLETIVEIGEEYKEDFEKMNGGHLDFVESLNDNPKWIRAVADLILDYSRKRV
jgi:protoporphyrin/coproporphyrin ferrochelatase